jgi:hypothetical protein
LFIMGIGVSIIDGLKKLSARVDNRNGTEKEGLVVATRGLKKYEPYLSFFINPTYGIDMNVNAAYSGSPEYVHDGTDNSYWTGTAISGVKFTFNSSAQNNTPGGSYSVLSNRSVTGNTAQFAKGSSLDLSGYVALTFYVYVDDNWVDDDSVIIFGWDTATSAMVGSSVAIEDYIDYGSFDKWQKAAVPLGQMSLTGETIDAIRVEVADTSGLPPAFFLDDIQFEESGTPLEYTIQPENGTWLYPRRLRLVAAAAYDTDEANGTVPGLAYDDLLGTALTNGIVTAIGGDFPLSFPVRQLSDFLQFPGASIDTIHDGTNTLITYSREYTDHTVLRSEDEDKVSIIIQDDLSGYLLMRASLDGYIERRNGGC